MIMSFIYGTNKLSLIFIVLAYCNNSPWLDIMFSESLDSSYIVLSFCVVTSVLFVFVRCLVSNVVCFSGFFLHALAFCVVTSVLFVFVLCLVSNVVCVSGFFLHCFSFLCCNFCFIYHYDDIFYVPNTFKDWSQFVFGSLRKWPQSGCTHSVTRVQGCVQPNWGYFEWTEQIISINPYKLIQIFLLWYWKIYLFFQNKANNRK